MQTHPCHAIRARRPAGFTMVELLVVIVIISVLMTMATVGLGNMGGNPVNAGIATAEAVFDEARSTAMSKNVRAAVLVAKELTENPAGDRRQLLVVHEAIDTATGAALLPNSSTPNWVLSSRGAMLPDQVFFSDTLSKSDHSSSTGGALEEISDSRIANKKTAQNGSYYIYVFNSEGICTTPGASFVIGRGARNLSRSASNNPPRVTASSKRDFSGFVVWRNGRTSTFSTPDQVSTSLPAVGGTF